MATASKPKLSLRETVQKLILDEVIESSGSGSAWKVLIMDDKTTRFVSSALSMFDIMEHNVSLVERLKLGRQPFPDMDAVYFISPTMESAERVMADFITPSRAEELPKIDGKSAVPITRYGAVHLIFTGSVDSRIMETFQTNSLLISKIKTFKELNFEFLAPETSVFHLDMNDSLNKIFGKTTAQSSYTNMVGRKLATMCITLNEHPNIRYQGSSSFAKAVATTIHQELLEYSRQNSSFVPHGNDSSTERERGQLLILDRSFDPLSPLMHEYTYQAMANDLLVLDEEGVLTYDTTTEKGATVEKKAILNSESDELWKEHRHKHIAKVIASIKERMDDILQTNSGAKLAQKKGVEMDMSSMAAAVKNLPQYQQTMNDLGRHVAISQRCMREFTSQGLLSLSVVEQSLSTGLDENGAECKGKKAVELMIKTLQSGLSNYLKLRLMAIFFICQRPVGSDDKRQIVQISKLKAADLQLLDNLDHFISSFEAASVTQTATGTATGNKGRFFSSFFGGSREVEKIASTAEGEYTDTRHVCQLKTLLEQLNSGQLPSDKYPSIGPSAPASNEAKSTAASARKHRATDRWGGGKDQKISNAGRLITFIGGGVSYTETREGYELMNKEGREVIVGGSHIITPAVYLNNLEELTH